MIKTKINVFMFSWYLTVNLIWLTTSSHRDDLNHAQIYFQVIVLVSWIFSVAFNTPMFLIATFDDKKQFCVWNWPQEWMSKVYSVAWLLVVVLPLIVMAGLYSRVARTLWFKHHSIHLSREQRVGVKIYVSRYFPLTHFNL